MNSILKTCFAMLLAAVLLPACQEDDAKQYGLQLTTQEISEISQTTALAGGYITINESGTVLRQGVCWSTDPWPDMTALTAESSEKQPVGNFTASLSGLTPATTYYVRAFAENNFGLVYGHQVKFTTRPAPTDGWCLIDGISGITPTSAVIEMAIADHGNAEILEYGVVFNSTGDPTLDDHKVVSDPGGYTFLAALTDLDQNTQYYVRPYFISQVGIFLGEQASFNTLNFIRSGAAFPGYRSAYLYGEVVMDAGSATTEKGVVWSTDPDPTLENGISKIVGDGPGSYYLLTGGLEKGKTYHMRAYAKNESGTYYGDNVTFTTRTGNILPGFDLSQMVLVEAGTFMMGEKDTQTVPSAIDNTTLGKEPLHEVTISRDFYICKYELTNEQLCTFLNAYQSTVRRNYGNQALYNGSGRTFSFNVSGSAPNLVYTPVAGGDRKPAGNITWGCAEQCVEWLSAELGVDVRLPTEAEWEFAARGGNKSKGYIYSGSDDSSEVAVFTSNTVGPAEVGSKAPNELGIYDMTGNIFEYCADAWNMDYYLPMVGNNTVDPYNQGIANAERLIRGGSFRHNTYFRVSARGKTQHEAEAGNHNGLRIVMSRLPESL